MSLEIKDLTFSYKTLPLCRKDAGEEKKLLNSFCATFDSGKITAVTGENGSGKTTMAKIIMGLLKADSCQLLVDGEDTEGWSLAERGRAIGYVMQNPAKQIFNETVLEEVAYGLLNQGLSEEAAVEVAKGYIEMFGLGHHLNDSPFMLSQGEKQRLVLAAIIAMKPGYLLLDEPTAGLDSKHREVLGRLLLRVARPEDGEACPGCGVIVISHDRKFIDEYCDGEVRLNG